jgi:cadmium resistance protein CadD (predicted permease)
LDPLISANAIVASANIAVLIALLVLYAKVYKTSKANFTIGLILFASLLMLHNIIAVYGYFMMEPLYAPALIPYFLAIHVAELGGLLVLFRITLL